MTIGSSVSSPMFAALEKAAPVAGCEFHTRDLATHLDGVASPFALMQALHKLRDAGYIAFTGRPLRWTRQK